MNQNPLSTPDNSASDDIAPEPSLAAPMSRALETVADGHDGSKVAWSGDKPRSMQVPPGQNDEAEIGEVPASVEAPDIWHWRWEMWRSRFFFDWHSRRIEAAVLAVSLVASLALLPQVLNFARRDRYARDIVPGAWLWQPLEALEYRLYDARFSARGAVKPPAADAIAIVAIDQSSLTRLGTWPWPRDWHAQLIRRLRGAGARVIAIDADFSDRQLPLLRQHRVVATDHELVAATAGGDVIYPAQLSLEESRAAGNASHLITPFEELDEATPDLSLAYAQKDSDGHVRAFPLRGRFNNADVPSLAALAVGIYQKRLDQAENTAFYRLLNSGQWPDRNGKRQRVPLSEVQIEDNRVWLTPLFFYGPPGTFATYSYSDVLREYSPALLRKYFGGRIVFVGATAQILKDLFPMPAFEAEHGQSEIPGVEMHATLAAQLLNGDWIRPTSTQSTLMALFALSLLSSGWIRALNEPISRLARGAQRGWARRGWPGRVHSVTWFGLYALAAWWPLLGFWQLTVWLFSARGVWLPAVYPLLGGILSGGGALLLLFVIESGERRKVLAHFGRTVSRDVLEEMLATHEEDYRAPRRVHATVLFSDLEGFTTYSEEREPEEVVAALNLYMDYMAPIVEAHGGSIDKYIGDAIMAFWNVPLPRYDHEAQALLCAVAMQDECARFRHETGIPFFMRIGVHSGPCLYGDVGSHGRANVTVIGDTVNIAARLEGKNKEFGSRIMCSQSTFEAAPDVVEADSAAAQIKGKSQQVEVYMVRGPRGAPDRDQQWARLAAAPDLPELGSASQALPEADGGASHALDNGVSTANSALPQLTEGQPEAPATLR